MRRRLREGKVRWGQSGYSGYSMSNRAVQAYEDGEMPKSKWTKTAILDAIKDYVEDNEDTLEYDSSIEKWTKDKLFDTFIEYKSWHHTGKYAQETDFYGLDEDYCDKYFVNQEKVNEKQRIEKEQNELAIKNIKEILSHPILNKEDIEKLCENYKLLNGGRRYISSWIQDINIIANKRATEKYLDNQLEFIFSSKITNRDDKIIGTNRNTKEDDIKALTDKDYAYLLLMDTDKWTNQDLNCCLKIDMQAVDYIIQNKKYSLNFNIYVVRDEKKFSEKYKNTSWWITNY